MQYLRCRHVLDESSEQLQQLHPGDLRAYTRKHHMHFVQFGTCTKSRGSNILRRLRHGAEPKCNGAERM